MEPRKLIDLPNLEPLIDNALASRCGHISSQISVHDQKQVLPWEDWNMMVEESRKRDN